MEEKLLRAQSKELNEILGKKFPVLDSGFIRCIDYLGNDDAIVQAARVSCGKGTKKALEDAELIRYLMRHEHLTPFEMCVLKLHIRVPMDCWRQWVRHRTSSLSEQSSRYSIMDNGFQETDEKEWRYQSKNNKQGSGGFFDEENGKILSEKEKTFHKIAKEVYDERIEMGVAREQARKDMPLSSYTEAYWKMDLRNLFNFLKLRMHPHAQKEIREYATVIYEEIVKKWVPVAANAFEDYILETITFSNREIKILEAPDDDILDYVKEFNWIPDDVFDNLEKYYYEG